MNYFQKVSEELYHYYGIVMFPKDISVFFYLEDIQRTSNSRIAAFAISKYLRYKDLQR